MHMVCASFLTGAFVVAGISAFQLLRRRFVDTSRVGLSMAMWAAILLAPLQIALGDRQGLNTEQYQPAKLAAMEGLWDTEHNVPATIFAWPDMAAEKNLYEISIPHLASVYLTHSWDGEVQGLKATPPENRPYAPLVFFAFRLMAGIGMTLLGLAITGAVLRWRGRLYDTRWFQYAAVAATPLGFVAVLAGWTVTETGRQPFVVYGLLRTADAASPVSPGAITASLICFLLIYAILFAGFLWFAARLAFKGPITIGAGAIAGHPWQPRSHSTVAIGASIIPAAAE
jgi:cytochrome bd ubiquinol oxidase subunit I